MVGWLSVGVWHAPPTRHITSSFSFHALLIAVHVTCGAALKLLQGTFSILVCYFLLYFLLKNDK
jgi:hypothetical protein